MSEAIAAGRHEPGERALERSLLWVALGVGIGLRAWQYFAGTSLWLDELALLNGVLSGPFRGIFDGQADFSQVAPPGFLIVEWLLHRAAPQSDLLLRGWSFAAGCTALFFVAALARESIGARYAWIPTLLVALSGPLIFTSSQVKPYSTDVLCTSAILLAAVRDARYADRSSRRLLALAGALSPFFSLPAVFVVAGVGGVYAIRAVFGRLTADRSRVVTMLAVWGAAILLSVWLASRLADPGAAGRWSSFERAFPVIPPRNLADLLWPAEQLTGVLSSLMGMRLASAMLLLAAVGWLSLVRRKSLVAWYLVLPLAAAFAAAALQKYPFGGRVSQWVVPILAILAGAGVLFVSSLLRNQVRLVGLALGAMVCLTPAMTLVREPPPYAPDHVKPLLRRIAAESRPGDQVYVYWGAWHSMHRYARDLPSDVRVSSGGCPRDFPRGHLRELESLGAGTRLWVLFDRVYAPAARAAILNYLDSTAARIDSLSTARASDDPTTRAELFLYDVSDTARRHRFNAESMPLPPDVSRQVPTCVGPSFMWRRSDQTMIVPVF